jgi:hypothetical protein
LDLLSEGVESNARLFVVFRFKSGEKFGSLRYLGPEPFAIFIPNCPKHFEDIQTLLRIQLNRKKRGWMQKHHPLGFTG